jgi:hypothetical protein
VRQKLLNGNFFGVFVLNFGNEFADCVVQANFPCSTESLCSSPSQSVSSNSPRRKSCQPSFFQRRNKRAIAERFAINDFSFVPDDDDRARKFFIGDVFFTKVNRFD